MLKQGIKKLIDKKDLSKEEAGAAMAEILSGNASKLDMAVFLTSLKIKGEAAEEVLGFVKELETKANKLSLNTPNLVDTCGTGGDSRGTFNISTTAAFIAAGAGAKIAKHGNRSITSSCGGADVLEKLGAKITEERTLSVDNAKKSIEESGFIFLFAPNHHSAIKHAMEVRRELGFRTVFNILGPLINPAGAERQLLGVYSKELVDLVGEVVLRKGLKRALVVHGADGLDEISLSGPTTICEVNNGKIKKYEICPEDFGIERADISELSGGNAEACANVLKNILSGEAGPKADIAIMNAGAAIYVSGITESIEEGIKIARESISSGKALKSLETYLKIFSEN